jgi:transcription termination factor Rho
MRIASGREIPQPRSKRGAPIKSDMYNKELFAKIQNCRERCINDKNFLIDNSVEDTSTDNVNEAAATQQSVESGMVEFYSGKCYLRHRAGNNFSARDTHIEDRYVNYFSLKSGDVLSVTTKFKDDGEQVVGSVLNINGEVANSNAERCDFETLSMAYPDKLLHVATSEDDFFGRSVDFVAPIAAGERVAIASPIGVDKGRVMREIAAKIAKNNPELYFAVILADCAGEEIVDYTNGIPKAELFSVSDNGALEGMRCARLALDYAKRKVEDGKDVVLILDDVTKLARIFNSNGGQVSSNLEFNSLATIKQYLNSAKKVVGGGTLTVLCAIDIDERDTFEGVLYGNLYNMFSVTITLSKELAKAHVYPPVDIRSSGAKREEMYMSKRALDALISLRKKSNEKEDNVKLYNLFERCGADEELYTTLLEDTN